jgi:hypothetical protein
VVTDRDRGWLSFSDGKKHKHGAGRRLCTRGHSTAQSRAMTAMLFARLCATLCAAMACVATAAPAALGAMASTTDPATITTTAARTSTTTTTSAGAGCTGVARCLDDPQCAQCISAVNATTHNQHSTDTTHLLSPHFLHVVGWLPPHRRTVRQPPSGRHSNILRWFFLRLCRQRRHAQLTRPLLASSIRRWLSWSRTSASRRTGWLWRFALSQSTRALSTHSADSVSLRCTLCPPLQATTSSPTPPSPR